MLGNRNEINGNGNNVAGRDINIHNYFGDGKNPLRFFDEEIKEVIMAFSKTSGSIGTSFAEVVNRTKAQEKNRLNNLSTRYFESIILPKSMCYFEQIESFLKSPINEDYMLMYVNTVEEINNKVIIYREQYEQFDEVFDHLYNQMIENAVNEFKSDRRLIWVFLHYMYWKCDLGEGGEC